MTDTIALTGLVATPPRHLVTGEGLAITSFRLASTPRRFDRGAQKWIDGETNWFTVTAFRQLAMNLAESLQKGQRVVVLGRIRVRAWEADERSGTTVEVTADALGQDLAWGTAVWTRSMSSAVAKTEDTFSEVEAEERAAVLVDGIAEEAPVPVGAGARPF
jgi:single-strand DNA-binding protein